MATASEAFERTDTLFCCVRVSRSLVPRYTVYWYHFLDGNIMTMWTLIRLKKVHYIPGQRGIVIRVFAENLVGVGFLVCLYIYSLSLIHI